MAWTCRRAEEGRRPEKRDERWRIVMWVKLEDLFFVCGQAAGHVSAVRRPDNLDTTSTTTCYSITEHRLTAAIQRHSPPQIHSHSAAAKLNLTSFVICSLHQGLFFYLDLRMMSPSGGRITWCSLSPQVSLKRPINLTWCTYCEHCKEQCFSFFSSLSFAVTSERLTVL